MGEVTFHLRPFLDPLMVADRDTNSLVPLRTAMTWPQSVLVQSVEDDINARKPVRYIVLKARQIGMSTIIEGLMFSFSVLLPRMAGLVVSHESDSNEHLLGITKTYFDNWWGKNILLTPANYAGNKVGWAENGSKIQVSTAKNSDAGRSRTIRFVHGSEVASWQDPIGLVRGLNNTVPRAPLTFFFLESTAKGVGDYFHQTWQAAVAGDVEYKPLFFAWWQHPNYRASRIGYAHVVDNVFIPVDDEERFLLKFLARKGMDATEIKDRMHWRRTILATECAGDINNLHQEFPSTDDEAFVSTGRNVFPINFLRGVYEPLIPRVGKLVNTARGPQFLEIPHGPLSIYRRPVADRAWGQYVMAGDPAFGGVAGDYSCAQVFNRNSWEQVATFRDRIDAATFGEQMTLLGRYYHNALAAPEATKGGGATVAVMRSRGYENLFIHSKEGNIKGQLETTYGWVTNTQTKPNAISNLQKALYDANQPAAKGAGLGIRIHDRVTFEEMKAYVKLDGNKFGNASGQEDHDDAVMATAIAISVLMYDAGASLGWGYEEPRHHELKSLASASAPAELSDFEQGIADLGGVAPAPLVHAGPDGSIHMEQTAISPAWLDHDDDLDEFE